MPNFLSDFRQVKNDGPELAAVRKSIIDFLLHAALIFGLPAIIFGS